MKRVKATLNHLEKVCKACSQTLKELRITTKTFESGAPNSLIPQLLGNGWSLNLDCSINRRKEMD